MAWAALPTLKSPEFACLLTPLMPLVTIAPNTLPTPPLLPPSTPTTNAASTLDSPPPNPPHQEDGYGRMALPHNTTPSATAMVRSTLCHPAAPLSLTSSPQARPHHQPPLLSSPYLGLTPPLCLTCLMQLMSCVPVHQDPRSSPWSR